MVGEDALIAGIELQERGPGVIFGTTIQIDLIPTAIPHLDAALEGGMTRGCLYVVLAPPKSLKSALLVNFAYGGMVNPDGLNVVYITNEIIGKQIGKRLDARIAGNLWPLRKSEPEKFSALMNDRVKKMCHGQLRIKTYPTRTCTPSMVRSYLTILAANGCSVDALVIDYADIMKAERRLGEMRHEQAGIYEDLREIGGVFNCAVATASQAKASAFEKETLTMADFAETAEKSAIMDVKPARLLPDGSRRRYAGGEDWCWWGSREGRLLTIGCRIDPAGMILSDGLYDAALMQVKTDHDDVTQDKPITPVSLRLANPPAVIHRAAAGNNRPKR